MSLEFNFVLPHWIYWGGLIAFPLAYMLILKLGLFGAGKGPTAADHPTTEELEAGESGYKGIDVPGNAFTRMADKLSVFSGVFVGYWTIIAVFVYFFEVVSRYFFNSPTNWAHESMYLMFGMQYILAGAFAYFHDAHVRVDLFYAKASPRGKAAIDIVTSMFFLIFALAFIWTGWTFFSSSMNQNQFFFARGYSNEVSFTEWAIAYYPVKATLVLGGLLLLVQGIARFIKDVQVFNRVGEAGTR